jgi:hypothetical protein
MLMMILSFLQQQQQDPKWILAAVDVLLLAAVKWRLVQLGRAVRKGT